MLTAVALAIGAVLVGLVVYLLITLRRHIRRQEAHDAKVDRRQDALTAMFAALVERLHATPPAPPEPPGPGIPAQRSPLRVVRNTGAAVALAAGAGAQWASRHTASIAMTGAAALVAGMVVLMTLPDGGRNRIAEPTAPAPSTLSAGASPTATSGVGPSPTATSAAPTAAADLSSGSTASALRPGGFPSGAPASQTVRPAPSVQAPSANQTPSTSPPLAPPPGSNPPISSAPPSSAGPPPSTAPPISVPPSSPPGQTITPAATCGIDLELDPIAKVCVLPHA